VYILISPIEGKNGIFEPRIGVSHSSIS